ncbi:28S ribosomal protein S28, mitochondrial [Acyrthosiphon pisum]|uniref:ACYPI007920 protein n=1 Tax=Acyrthosiphon pisum TaxID=7029 RepID=C4WX26_ACYPI|nr:28S ribosomal protein S28, mitochondrial [Acyrthosiphon pisum]BAH72446.1 ACYPI007920 [Acyrthosiphon pisum]|eukprot:NP_001156254.1 28S ribosomal protein S28, mitochondrial [Acyrthosiphon pisum]
MASACRIFCRNINNTPLSKIITTKLRVSTKKFIRPYSEQQDKLATLKHGAFAEFYEKTKENKLVVEEDQDFEMLLRNSNFINLGDPEGKQVIGTIFHIVDNDLYIDFGWKFHCVCTRPIKNADSFVRGSQVKLRIKSLELATRFLGSEKDLTLLEADAALLSLHKPIKY